VFNLLEMRLKRTTGVATVGLALLLVAPACALAADAPNAASGGGAVGSTGADSAPARPGAAGPNTAAGGGARSGATPVVPAPAPAPRVFLPRRAPAPAAPAPAPRTAKPPKRARKHRRAAHPARKPAAPQTVAVSAAAERSVNTTSATEPPLGVSASGPAEAIAGAAPATDLTPYIALLALLTAFAVCVRTAIRTLR
jgi:hypothetical protein